MKRLEMLVVSLMGQIKLVPLPDWSPPGVKLNLSDEHPWGVLMGVTLGGSIIGLSVVQRLGVHVKWF